MFFISKKAFNNAVDKAVCEVQRRESMEMRALDMGHKLVELEDRVCRLEHMFRRLKGKAVEGC